MLKFKLISNDMALAKFLCRENQFLDC